jgi:hypothetical protein
MDTRIFHGDIQPEDVARALIAQFNRGNLRAQQLGSGGKVVVQIATRDQASSGGKTALSVSLQKVSDGLAVQVGEQNWLGVAASVGKTAFTAMLNPWNLLGRLDDIAQDIENIQLYDQVMKVIADEARTAKASFELSDRLRRSICEYCNTPNAVGEASCIACGAPLGDVQPYTCTKCGFVIKKGGTICPNCRQKV